MKQTELVAIGGAYVDINCSHFPFGERGLVVETETVGNSYQVEPGGSAVNFARLCRALDIPTTFVGKVGNDAMGVQLTHMLEDAGIRPELIVDDNQATNVSFNMVNQAGRTIMAVVGSANQSLTSDEVYDRVSARLTTATHLFIGGCFKLTALLPAFNQLAAAAKAHDTKLVLDHARLHSGTTEADKTVVRELAKTADYYLPSADEFMELWEVDSIEEGLHLLAPQAVGTIAVKDGDQGAVTIIDGEIVRVPAFGVQLIHTVGAGDSFNAGFIAAQSEGNDTLGSIRFGCATAALKISQSGLPNRHDIEQLLAA